MSIAPLLAELSVGFWSAVPTFLWVTLIIGVLYTFNVPISEIVSHFVNRIRAGAGVKIYGIEVDAVRKADQNENPAAEIGVSSIQNPEQASPGPTLPLSPVAYQLGWERQQHYSLTRRIMMVHRLYRSAKPGQIYDVLIYLVPHSAGSLIEVSRVEYFLGRYWGNEIFESGDRSRGYPILTSAYGTFLASARLTFNDGTSTTVYRYIDFEMGESAPMLSDKTNK